jgi:hypothetical protein
LNKRERKSSGNQGIRYVPRHLRSGDLNDVPLKENENNQPDEFKENNNRGCENGSDRDFNNR